MAKGPIKRQRDPLFDLPEARADYVRVGLLDSYSDLEAAAYLVGCNPDVVNQHTVAAFPSSRKAKRFNEILEALPHAVNIRNSEGRILPESLSLLAEVSG